MIALDTNAIVRVLIEDDASQAKRVQERIGRAESEGTRILILCEVLIETVWVLESIYHCERQEIAMMIETFLAAQTYYLPDSAVIRKAIKHYRKGGDFADMVIVGQAKTHQADKLFSFDRKLQKRFPDFVSEE